MQVDIRDPSHWEVLRAQLGAHGGITVQVSQEALPRPFSQVEAVFVGPGGEFARATGQAVHITPQGLVSLVFSAEVRAMLLAACPAAAPADAAARAPSQAPTGEGIAEEALDGPREGRAAAAAPGGPPEEARPLWMRYVGLPMAEKVRLARQGNLEARRLVLKDRDQSLHQHLLNNPGLTTEEVAMLIRSGGAGAAFIQGVAKRPDLLSNPGVAEAIVLHPRTPVPLALQLVPRLSLDVARRIARSGELRLPIVQAARRRVIL